MGYSDESNQNLESENATTNNDNEATEHQFGLNKKLISFTSSSSSVSSDFSLEDLEILDGEHDKSSLTLEADDDHLATNNENLSASGSPTIQLMERQETCRYGIPSHVYARTGPGNWSMASNESLFSIHMGGTSFCRLDSQVTDGKIVEMDDENNQGSSILDESTYKEDEAGNHTSATRSSSSNSFVFPILSGETENGGSPQPRGSLIGPVPQSPPKPTASEAKAEAKETTTFIAWTKWTWSLVATKISLVVEEASLRCDGGV
ncbi:hypothetical protein L1987_44778 [Smallanthus sonchifolius]|uniref:Uncharacterized protein n=1 Tax=Smallanthus sonchifolius TaxID=185202 RepID=A0ACB9GQ82_9ASTR|nr:hypothetical protein L1987_44778 [Smallanthus sonchifolius]